MKVVFINHGTCCGYNCKNEVALWAELDEKISGWEVPDDEWEDPFYSFIGHWDTVVQDNMCRSCIASGNFNPLKITIIDDAQISQAVSSIVTHGVTGYIFELRDVTGEVYTTCTVVSPTGNLMFIHDSAGITSSVRRVAKQSKP